MRQEYKYIVTINKTFHINVLTELPVAILILRPDYSFQFGNKLFDALMALAAIEFGSVERATLDFIAAVQTHKHKGEWLMRINQANPSELVLLKIIRTSLRLEHESELIVHTIIAERAVTQKDVKGYRNYLLGSLRVDMSNETVYFGRNLIFTSPTEFRLLAAFCSQPEMLLLKSDLLKTVWQRRALNTRTLDVYVSRLNRKLRDAGVRDHPIVPIHGKGYIFQTLKLIAQ